MQHEPDWDPRSPEVLEDQLSAYDALRRRCPVAYDPYLGWSLLRHSDVVAALHDHQTFSNDVSRHLTVPNGMDPPQHTAYREIVDRYFTDDLMDRFEPDCREVVRAVLAEVPRDVPVDVMEAVARPMALRLQSRWLGWPRELERPLHDWTLRNHRATLSRDREAASAVALEFDGYIRDLLEARRSAGADAPDDLTTRLMHERVHDRPLDDDEIVSILRNWTVGELSTIAASVGIVASYLATRPDLADRLRSEPSLVTTAVDEILRIHPPLIANRRVTTRDVEVSGRRIPGGERVTVLWASANRDEAVFGDPDEPRLDRDPRDNLLYGAGIHVCPGAGIHVCPGAPLARMELRIATAELLAATSTLREAAPGTRAAYPASGWSELPLVLGG